MPYNPTWINPYLSQPYTQPYNAFQPTPVQYSQGSAQPTSGIVKVNGRDSALQYQLPPNSMSPALFDNNGRVFYIVSTDGTGMKTVETFDFTEHKEEAPVQIDGAQFVSRKEFDEFVAKVQAAMEVIDGSNAAVSAGAAAKPAALDDARPDKDA